MTMDIFSEWVKMWDRSLQTSKRKVVLLVDNCTAHSITANLKSIEIVYLPANTTSILQPCDQGIIRTLKARYRNEMRRRILNEIDNEDSTANVIAKKTSLLDALHLIKKSWADVTETTIKNCFKKGGFSFIEVSL